jgi:hypothetical protein
MKHLKQFENWTSTSTDNKEVEYDYTSKNSIYHGIHDINISRDGIRTKVKAKFDSGARSSSIDFKVAKRLGVSDEFIQKCKELDSVDLGNYVKNPKVISKLEQTKIENTFYKDLKAQFPELAEVKLVKSSSGFSVRMVIRVNLEFNGKVISTDANLRDRTGLACEMLVGLKDM